MPHEYQLPQHLRARRKALSRCLEVIASLWNIKMVVKDKKQEFVPAEVFGGDVLALLNKSPGQQFHRSKTKWNSKELKAKVVASFGVPQWRTKMAFILTNSGFQVLSGELNRCPTIAQKFAKIDSWLKAPILDSILQEFRVDSGLCDLFALWGATASRTLPGVFVTCCNPPQVVGDLFAKVLNTANGDFLNSRMHNVFQVSRKSPRLNKVLTAVLDFCRKGDYAAKRYAEISELCFQKQMQMTMSVSMADAKIMSVPMADAKTKSVDSSAMSVDNTNVMSAASLAVQHSAKCAESQSVVVSAAYNGSMRVPLHSAAKGQRESKDQRKSQVSKSKVHKHVTASSCQLSEDSSKVDKTMSVVSLVESSSSTVPVPCELANRRKSEEPIVSVLSKVRSISLSGVECDSTVHTEDISSEVDLVTSDEETETDSGESEYDCTDISEGEAEETEETESAEESCDRIQPLSEGCKLLFADAFTDPSVARLNYASEFEENKVFERHLNGFFEKNGIRPRRKVLMEVQRVRRIDDSAEECGKREETTFVNRSDALYVETKDCYAVDESTDFESVAVRCRFDLKVHSIVGYVLGKTQQLLSEHMEDIVNFQKEERALLSVFALKCQFKESAAVVVKYYHPRSARVPEDGDAMFHLVRNAIGHKVMATHSAMKPNCMLLPIVVNRFPVFMLVTLAAIRKNSCLVISVSEDQLWLGGNGDSVVMRKVLLSDQSWRSCQSQANEELSDSCDEDSDMCSVSTCKSQAKRKRFGMQQTDCWTAVLDEERASERILPQKKRKR